jgi:hypothetical protein
LHDSEAAQPHVEHRLVLRKETCRVCPADGPDAFRPDRFSGCLDRLVGEKSRLLRRCGPVDKLLLR